MIFLIRIVPFSDRQSYMNVMESLTSVGLGPARGLFLRPGPKPARAEP
jgi:hypothetical protein